jgi:2-oxo-3-hexenedioate decarboxylase
MAISTTDLDAITAESFALLGTGRQTAPFTSRFQNFDLADAFRVTPSLRRLREQRGERVIGRKIGFTNRTIWPEYGVYAPIWGYMYDRTVFEIADVAGGFPLAGLSEPRIEPEIVLHFAIAPVPGMDEAALLGCIDWIAHGFELVQSIFPAWKFAAADTIAAYGLHGAYLIGERHEIGGNEDAWLKALGNFNIELFRNGQSAGRGKSTDVLDGPLTALKHLNDLLADDPGNPPLAAGEMVTTGTLTAAFPVVPGETWSTKLDSIDLPGNSVTFR